MVSVLLDELADAETPPGIISKKGFFTARALPICVNLRQLPCGVVIRKISNIFG
jgi:hypothetical protein